MFDAIASLLGGERANAANREIAHNNNVWSERMANSAHQREVDDLRAAGLNPILSAGGNGASTPSAQGATMLDTISPAVASAREAKQLKMNEEKQNQEIQNMKKAGNLTDAQKEKTQFESLLLKNELPKTNIMSDFYQSGKKIYDDLDSYKLKNFLPWMEKKIKSNRDTWKETIDMMEKNNSKKFKLENK